MDDTNKRKIHVTTIHPRSWRHRFGWKFVTAHSDAVVESFRRIVTISFSFLFQSLTWCSCEWTRNHKNSPFFRALPVVLRMKNYLKKCFFIVCKKITEWKSFCKEMTHSGSYQIDYVHVNVWRHPANVCGLKTSVLWE